jgi:hypothetical protein
MIDDLTVAATSRLVVDGSGSPAGIRGGIDAVLRGGHS